MIAPVVLWSSTAGVAFLLLGLFAVRRDFFASTGLERVIALGRVFFAAPLAAFGVEHLILAQFIMQGVPVWMPWRLFWAYFVGTALIAAALSFVLKRYVHLSAMLFAIMLFLFVAMIHLPNAAAHPGDRIIWAVVLRDLAFGGAALAYAGFLTKRKRERKIAILVGQLCFALPVIFFGVEVLMHPQFAPGVPLGMMTPKWVPVSYFWAFLTGAALLVAGVGMLIARFSRAAACLAGIVMVVLTACLYLPILLMASGTAGLVEGINYVADTLLFGGAALLLAAAMPGRSPALFVAHSSVAAD